MTHVEKPATWSGLTLQIGDYCHVLPVYEDERIHDVHSGEDCHCSPDIGVKFGERKHEPPMTIVTHKPVKATQQ